MTVVTKRQTLDNQKEPVPTFSDKEVLKKFVNPYTTIKGLREAVFTTISFSMLVVKAVYLIQYYKPVYNLYILPSAFAGLIIADFVSGVIHWVLDSYFSVRTPFIGHLILRPFRIHHVAPTAITFNYLLRSFGDIAVLVIPQQIIPMVLIYFYREESLLMYCLMINFFVQYFLGFWTNMIHRWAHTHGQPVPTIVKFLQQIGLLISVKEHHKHHTPPFTNYYCLITGHCNYPLEAINFWRNTEWVIEKITGTKARMYPDLEE